MKKITLLKTTMSLTLLASIVACTPNISPDVDQAANANQAMNTVHGTVVSMRTMTVKGNDNNVGMLAGGAAGAVAGSAIGGGDRMHLLGAIGGALAGGALGNLAQDKLTQQQGTEYIVKTDSGHYVTVVQSAGAQQLRIGQGVFVVEGAHARIVGVE